jgi:hypothetical protein
MHKMDQKNQLLLKAWDFRYPMGRPLHDSPLGREHSLPVMQRNKAPDSLSGKNINSIIRHHLHSFRSSAKATSHHRM